MRWWDWISVAAVLLTVYFAWRTVAEAHATRIEEEKARRVVRLERTGLILGEIASDLDNGNIVAARRRQVELRFALMVAGLPRETWRDAWTLVTDPLLASETSIKALQARTVLDRLADEVA